MVSSQNYRQTFYLLSIRLQAGHFPRAGFKDDIMNLTFTSVWPKTIQPILFVASLLFFGWMPTQVNAQSCTYTVEMFDSFGDGWNGGVLTISVNGTTNTYTLGPGLSNGNATFEIADLSLLIISYQAGSFPTEVSYNILNAQDETIFSDGDPGNFIAPEQGVVYTAIACCASSNCDSPAPDLILVPANQLTDSSAYVNWVSVPGAVSYQVEYGPSGFPFGQGIKIDSIPSNATLTGLNPCVKYDVYVRTDCGNGLSCPSGPVTLQTDCPTLIPGGTCTYTLEFFDSFGDGWNGASLKVDNNGNSSTFTLPSGFETTHTFTATSNTIINFTYSSGSFPNEVTYNILDPDGQVIFSAGPGPASGLVLSTLACPSCPGPKIFMQDVNADNATVAWNPNPNANGNYKVEYGPLGFTLGTGTELNIVGSLSSALLAGLQENTWYDVYVSLDCGTESSLPTNPITFKTLWLHDVGVSGITMPSMDECNLGSSEMVTIGLHNFGQKPETLFEFFFAVNGVPVSIPTPQDGLFTGVVGNDSTQSISFETTYDFSVPGYYLIEVWTNLDGDSNHSNDTFSIKIVTAFSLPLQEDFEDGAVDPLWTLTGGNIYPPFFHDNETYVLGANLFSSFSSFTVTTQRFGVVGQNDNLSFDYRYVDWPSGTVATNIGTNKLEVQISEDCGETFETIFTVNSTNHVASTDMATITVPLDAYEGKAINLRFLPTYGSGDYWLDLDNINITGCPANLGLSAEIQGSLENGQTGSISLTPNLGAPPYNYDWNVGMDSSYNANLPAGVYEVTVTDANGCQQVAVYEVGYFVNADEAAGIQSLNLFPNPTGDVAFLDITLEQTMDFTVRLFNLNGQAIFESNFQNVNNARQEFNIANQPPGMYIVQIVAGGKPHYAKLMVAR